MMKKYFYTDGTSTFGPHAPEELKGLIAPQTLVWFEGLPDWQPAGEVSELRTLFAPAAPPPPNPAMYQPSAPMAPPPQSPAYHSNPNPAPSYPPNYGGTPPQFHQQPGMHQPPRNQPPMGGGQKPPKTWLTESILATILCCLPLGIVGILNATKVEAKFNAGDIEGAMKASADAAKWTKIAAIAGGAVLLIYIIMMAAGVVSLGGGY
jgi:hypothetical protein